MKIQDHKELLATYGINTPLRLAAFLAQIDHESQGFTRTVENLNYSAAALTATWPKRFPPEIAKQYHRQPERIANRAYADRMGNGAESSGDGWRYRGRGYIQLTGHDNYVDFSRHKGIPIEEVAAYLETEQGAMESAAWWYSSRNLNALADMGDIKRMTKIINGGYNGLADRVALYDKYKTEVV